MNENMLKGVDGNFYSTSEELRRADKDWNRRNLLYLGHDGNFYSTSEELRRADKDWNRRNLLYLGHDGNFYSTSEELNEANRRYWQTLKPKEYPSERRLNEMCGNSARREAEMMKKMPEKRYSIKNFNKN